MPDSDLKASVVIPSRGGATRLPRLIECLRAQTHTNWEAIVVLDGDIDNSEQVVASFSDLPVRAIVFPENRGRVAALNAGFGEATGDVLIRCDDDLAPRPDYLANHVAHHRGEPVGVIGLVRNVFPDTSYARTYGSQIDTTFRDEAYRVPPEGRWRYWSANVSVSKSTHDLIGPYDRDYRAYGWEDVDWGYRLAEAGIPIVFDPALETDHHIAATTTKIRTLRSYHSGAAQHVFEGKHGVIERSQPEPSLWNRAVSLLGDHLTLPRVEKWSEQVDNLLPKLPPAVGKKLIALMVESSAKAGYEHPTETRTDF